MNNSDIHFRLDAARLGIEAEAFKNSNLGQFLLRRAEEEAEHLLQELVNLKPNDIEGNTDIRNQLHVIAMFKTFLDEVESSGKVATQQIREAEQQID